MIKAKFCIQCGRGLVTRPAGDRAYPACPDETCGFVFWDNPLPVVAALIEHEGAVVLARNSAWPEKMFGLVTGFLEKGEGPEDAVVREVKEELGLAATVGGLIGVYPFIEKNQVIVAYHLRAEGTIVLGDEIAQVRHVPAGKLRPWPFGTGHAVRDWLARRA
ncbi:MAG: NUDIX domain-containing protein [Spirochaetes bacterium]|nr:MAG: NUDIX domain-containing protein [Spirochaetota bacterium]